MNLLRCCALFGTGLDGVGLGGVEGRIAKYAWG